MPALLPVSTTIVLIRLIEGFKIIDMPNILLGGGPGTATQSMTLQAWIDWNTLNLGRSAAIAYLLLILVTIVATVYVSFVRRRVDDGRMTNPFRRRSTSDLSPLAKFGAFLLLAGLDVRRPVPDLLAGRHVVQDALPGRQGPVLHPVRRLPPTLDAWHYILVELGNDTLRPYVNTVIVGLSSSVIALILGSVTAYALVRFTYRPRVGDDRPVHPVHRRWSLVGIALGGPPPIVIAARARRVPDPRPDHRPPVHAGPSATATSRSG